MKKILTAIAFSVMTATAITAAAQPPDCGMGRGQEPCYQQGPGAGYGPGRQGGKVSAEDRINRRVERMATRLKLTDEQKAQVKTILQEEDNKLAATWKETHDRIAGVLTDEQRAQFEQWRAQRGPGGKGPGRGPGKGPSPGDGQGPASGPQN